MPSKKKNISTEEKIEKAAISEFAGNGFHGARIDRMAERAKINKAMIYYHYKGKEALYEHVLGLIATDLYQKVDPLIPDGSFSREEFENLVRGYALYVGTMEADRLRIMLRELTSGGKYFKKITVPILLKPVMQKITAMFTLGTASGVLRDLNPLYTMVQIVGSIIFFNILKNTLQDSPFIKENLFHGDFVNDYTENILKMYEGGIFSGEGDV